jgi:hypothetical protein
MVARCGWRWMVVVKGGRAGNGPRTRPSERLRNNWGCPFSEGEREGKKRDGGSKSWLAVGGWPRYVPPSFLSLLNPLPQSCQPTHTAPDPGPQTPDPGRGTARRHRADCLPSCAEWTIRKYRPAWGRACRREEGGETGWIGAGSRDYIEQTSKRFAHKQQACCSLLAGGERVDGYLSLVSDRGLCLVAP